jgi:hypothetical protein
LSKKVYVFNPQQLIIEFFFAIFIILIISVI